MALKPRRPFRSEIAYLHDLIMAGLSFVLAFYLRVGDGLAEFGHLPWVGALVFVLIAAAMFRIVGLYGGVWRYASMNDLLAITRAATLSILVFLPVLFLVTRLHMFPRSLPFIHWFVLMALLGGPRFVYRMLKDGRQRSKMAASSRAGIPVLLIGAGDESETFIRAELRNPQPAYRILGLLAVLGGRVGRSIHGVDVLGTVEDLPLVLERLRAKGTSPEKLILTSGRLSGGQIRQLLELADAQGVAMARMPRLTDLQSLGDTLQVRPIAVEDLLGRPEANLDRGGIAALIGGRRVVVTGAGGSIGSELVRQVAALRPAHVTLLEASEFALYTIDREMAEQFPDIPRRAVIANVRDRARLDEVWSEARPELVFHAAALKHVPLVEENPIEGIQTNILGSRNVADACVAHGTATMVMISTDKAVNPTNVMGATKRAAEMYTQALDLAGKGTRFLTVRFGNVLGSTGSVVPLFQRQLAAGGPITVTHPDVVRYFMTIREAVELVLQASALGTASHDEGKIYVLDMGEPVKIVDLARQMIRLAGLRPDEDIKIAFTGLRAGEKLFEEIFHGAEAPVPTSRDGVLLAAPRSVELAEIESFLKGLEQDCSRGAEALVLQRLQGLVPEFDRMDLKAVS